VIEISVSVNYRTGVIEISVSVNYRKWCD